jgi:hypothetical protein
MTVVYSNRAPLSDEITSADLLLTIPGLTYRRLDHWARSGYIRPNEETPGSGIARTWADEEVAVLRRMVRLVYAGMVPPAAAELARRGFGRHEIGPGLVLEVA